MFPRHKYRKENSSHIKNTHRNAADSDQFDDHDFLSNYRHDDNHRIVLDNTEIQDGMAVISVFNGAENLESVDLNYDITVSFKNSVNCPTGLNGQICSGRGTCVSEIGRCNCNDGYTLDDCSAYVVFLKSKYDSLVSRESIISCLELWTENPSNDEYPFEHRYGIHQINIPDSGETSVSVVTSDNKFIEPDGWAFYAIPIGCVKQGMHFDLSVDSTSRCFSDHRNTHTHNTRTPQVRPQETQNLFCIQESENFLS